MAQAGSPPREKPAQLAQAAGAVEDEKVNLPAPKPLTRTFPPLEESAKAQIAKLENAVEESMPGFRLLPRSHVDEAGLHLAQAVGDLNAYLAGLGANGSSWKRYLLWEQLLGQFGTGKPPDLAVLKEVTGRFRAEYPGLELPVFTNLRGWLQYYTNLVDAGQRVGSREAYQAQLKAIRQALAKYRESGSPDELSLLEGAVSTLEQAGQAPELVATLREEFSRPNLQIEATSHLVTAGIARHVDDTLPLRDSILGTFVTGTGHTVGEVTGKLLPDPNHLSLNTILAATTQSQTVGANGPARIYSSGQTQLYGQKVIYFDQTGWHSMPTAAVATTATQVTGVGSTKHGIIDHIVKRVAWRKIPEKKAASDREAASRAQAKLESRMDTEAAVMVEKADRAYQTKIWQPLVRHDATPSLFQTATTPDLVRLVVTESRHQQFGAPDAPPAFPHAGEFTLRLHESLVNNLAEAVFSGRSFDRASVERGVIEALGSLPERMRRDDDQTNWTITFGDDPITVKIDDDQLEITIRGTHYKQGNKNFEAMNIVARYVLSQTPDGVLAERVGGLSIYPPNLGPNRPMAVRQKVLESMLKRRFDKIFEPRFPGENDPVGLRLPGAWSKLGPLIARRFKADDGWLQMSWDEQQPGTAARRSRASRQ